MLGREFRLFSGTLVRVVEDAGIYWKVKNLEAGHTSMYEKKDWANLRKTETKASVLRYAIKKIRNV